MGRSFQLKPKHPTHPMQQQIQIFTARGKRWFAPYVAGECSVVPFYKTAWRQSTYWGALVLMNRRAMTDQDARPIETVRTK